MADAKKKAAPRKVVDVSGVVMLTDVTIPKSVRGSKYPWAQLVANGGNGGFFVPFSSEASAKRTRTSIQTSGRSYMSARDLPYKAVCFVSKEGESWGVTGAIVPTSK
jgi:hypothetical protein